MSETRVSRTVETDLSADELWALVGDATSWTSWMVDEAAVEVAPGATGTVVDGGTARSVRIDHVGHGRLDFTWWPADDPHLASTVELVVAPGERGSVLHVTERLPASATVAAACSVAMAWDIRTLLLVLAAVPSRV